MAFVQRQYVPNTVIPREDRVDAALDENVIADHLEKYLLRNDNNDRCFVFSAPLGGPHVYCFPPSAELNRPHWTLVTMGMSGTRMGVPVDVADASDYERAELMLYLPADWVFPSALGVGEEGLTNQSWPIELLRSLVRYVSTTGAWLAENHGIPNIMSDPPGLCFVPDTKLSHLILLDPVGEEEGMSSVIVNGSRVNFYLVIPLTAAEAAWKREVGAAQSIYYIVGSKAEGGGNVMVDYVIDPARPCAVTDLGAKEIFCKDDDEDEDGWEDVDDEDDEDNDGEEGSDEKP